MSEKQYTIDDMINAARAESPSDFQSAFASIVLDKIADSIEAKKIEVAKNYFNYEEEPGEDSDTTAELETDEDEETPDENTEATAGEDGQA